MKNSVAVVAVAAALAIGGTSGAVASNLIDSGDVKNNSLRSADLMDGRAVGVKDLKPSVLRYIKAHAGTDGVDAAPGQAELPGVQTNWEEVDGAQILSSTSVEVTNEGTTAGGSVQIENLNLSVQAGETVTFTYELKDGAVYGGGSPRVFLQITDNYYNTFDAAPGDAGEANDDGTFTKSWTIPKNGLVREAGVAVDHGVGSVIVSDVTIDGKVLSFN